MNITEEEILVETDVKTEEETNNDKEYKLVIYNDDYNTFEKVILALMNYCSMVLEEAHHCTLKIHNEGSCVVMRDLKSVLEPICENINDIGIDANIEEDKK